MILSSPLLPTCPLFPCPHLLSPAPLVRPLVPSSLHSCPALSPSWAHPLTSASPPLRLLSLFSVSCISPRIHVTLTGSLTASSPLYPRPFCPSSLLLHKMDLPLVPHQTHKAVCNRHRNSLQQIPEKPGNRSERSPHPLNSLIPLILHVTIP